MSSSQNDSSAAPVEAPRRASQESNVATEASNRFGAEAYDEMSRRSTATDARESVNPVKAPGDQSVNPSPTLTERPDSKDKGVVSMDIDQNGKSRFKYNPEQRNDRMSSMVSESGDGTSFTRREFDGRKDGMTSLVTSEIKGESVSNTRSFDTSRSANGLAHEQVLSHADGGSSTVRNFDASKNPNRMQTEIIKDSATARQTNRTFQDAPNGLQSQQINVDKASGAERTTYKFASGNTVQVDKASPDAKPQVQSFDASGKPITAPEGAQQKQGEVKAGTRDGAQPQAGEKPQIGEKPLTRDQKIEQDLAKFQQGLEKGNKLPALEAGQGPYQAIQKAIKNGDMPKMSHKEILAEARHIRDRDKADGKGSYKVGQQLERLSKPEMAKKVEAESKRLQQETPGKSEKPETPGQPEKPIVPGQTDKPLTPDQPEKPVIPGQPEKPGQSEKPVPNKPEELEPRKPGTDVPPEKKGLQVENRGASPEFVARVQRAYDALPAEQRKALEDSGYKVVVGSKVTDIEPSLKDELPRGHLPGVTWDHLDGFHNANTKTIAVAETHLDRNGNVNKSQRAEGVLKHESGHAMDVALGYVSQTPEFEQAFQQDAAKLSPFEKMKLQYLMNKEGGAGKSETFAEVYGAINGASSNPSETDATLRQFPNVAKLVRERMAKLPK
jgi:hypothetical protein